MCSFNEIDAGKKEDGTQYAIYDQTFYLPCCTGRLHKKYSEIDQPGNPKQGENNTKYTLYIHIDPLSLQVAKKLPAFTKGIHLSLSLALQFTQQDGQ